MNRIISVSATQATHWYPTKFFLGSCSTLCFILLFCYNYLKQQHAWMTWYYSIAIGLCGLFTIYVILFLVFAIKNIKNYIHEKWIDSIWTKALNGFTESYTNINQLRRMKNETANELPTSLICLCDSLKNAFDVLTDSDCCVSIKVPVSDDNNHGIASLEMKNLCRDSKHSNRDTNEYMNARHTIIGNTAYSVIVRNIMSRNQQKQCYINNDVIHTKDYATTSPQRNDETGLPYQSEIVYPIMPGTKDAQDLSGFICVDSPKINAFKYPDSERSMIAAKAFGKRRIAGMK